MAAAMLRVTYGESTRCCQFALSAIPRRFIQADATQTSTDDDVIPEVTYPPVRGKYPPGDKAEGTGWEGMNSKESWVWDRQSKRMKLYSASVEKRIGFLANQPVKTWKFPTVQWGKGSLNYMGDKTKTHIINDDTFLNNIDQYKTCNVEKAVQIISPIVLESLKLEQKMARQKAKDSCIAKLSEPRDGLYQSFENFQSHLTVKNLLNTILSTAQSELFGKIKHLNECVLDEDVDVAAHWSRDGVCRHPPFKPSTEALPNNALFHAQHTVDFQIRTHRPLKEFYDRENELCRTCSYPKVPYKPSALGYRALSMTRPVIPGFKLGTPYEFIHLSVVHTNEKRIADAVKHFGENEDLIKGYALSTGFVAAVSQAHFQGFNMLAELTYPFATQTMLTDGQTFYFSAYQLNTLEMWRTDKGNNRQNLCWISEPHKLYETDSDGNITNLNSSTLEKILKLVLLETTSERDHELSPRINHKPKPGDKVKLMIPKKVKEIKIKEQDTVY